MSAEARAAEHGFEMRHAGIVARHEPAGFSTARGNRSRGATPTLEPGG